MLHMWNILTQNKSFLLVPSLWLIPNKLLLISNNILHWLHLLFCFWRYFWLAVHRGTINIPSRSLVFCLFPLSRRRSACQNLAATSLTLQVIASEKCPSHNFSSLMNYVLCCMDSDENWRVFFAYVLCQLENGHPLMMAMKWKNLVSNINFVIIHLCEVGGLSKSETGR